MAKQKNGGGMSLSRMAGYFHMNFDDMIGGLKAVGILNKNGSPKKKYINEELFYEDGTIADYEELKNLISAKLGLQ